VARKDDYAKAGVPMLPVTHGSEVTKSFIVYYTILLLIISVLPYITGMTGVLYLFAAVLLGAGFLYYAIRLKWGQDEAVAMKTFGYSISYLMALFSFLLADHYIPVVWPE
jgi:protoheme IX farnesyltransferase